MKKYELTNEKIKYPGRTLHRIKALKNFSDVKKGDIGGFVENESNLSQEGYAWVYDDAKVYDGAKLSGNACAFGKSEVSGNACIREFAIVSGNACVSDDVEVSGNAWISGNAWLFGDAVIKSNRDYIVFKNWWSSGRYFTWTRSNDRWKVGCFYGTGEELIKMAYEHSAIKGREYERIVNYVEEIKKVNE